MNSPATSTTVGSGAFPFILKANASAAGSKTITKVKFYANGALVGTANSPASGNTWQVTWSYPGPGSYDVYAVAIDSDGGSSTSGSVTVTVN
jgi:hypothetical protein